MKTKNIIIWIIVILVILFILIQLDIISLNLKTLFSIVPRSGAGGGTSFSGP